MTRTIATLLLLGTTAAPALAQSPSPGFIRGFGGVSFMTETGGVFGTTVGLRLTGTLDVIGDVGGLTNMLPDSIQRDLDDAARAMGGFYGAPLTIDLRAPGVYALGGLRASHTTAQRMKLFIEGGAGVAHGTSDLSANAAGIDVSREVTAVLRLKHSITEPLVMVGAGVGIPLAGRLTVDLGYRFMRVFTDEPRIDTATMTAGFSWGF